MAHIPFGYRIVSGKARVHPGQAEQYRRFVNYYLHGASIRDACAAAGIEVSYATARRMLTSPVYTGTEYYPAILTKETAEDILEETERRTMPATTGCADPIPVERSFIIREPDPEKYREISPEERIAYIYSLIRPSSRGHDTMSREDILWFRRLKEGSENLQK